MTKTKRMSFISNTIPLLAVIWVLTSGYKIDDLNISSNCSNFLQNRTSKGFYNYAQSVVCSNEDVSDYSFDYAPYYRGIVRAAEQVDGTRIEILTYLNTSRKHAHVLSNILKRLNKEVFTYQLNSTLYGMTEIIEYFRDVRPSTVIMLVSWYFAENLLERLASYTVNEVSYISVEVNLLFIRSIKKRNPYLRVRNIMKLEKLRNDCQRVPSSLSTTRYNIAICDEIQGKIITFATIFANDKHVFQTTTVQPVTQDSNCHTGVPCSISKRVNNRTEWNWICCSGIYVEILKIIVSKLKTKFDLYLVEDNQYGKFKNGSWSGMIEAVYSKRADIALHQINILEKRFTAVDFTFPLTKSPKTLGIARHKFSPVYDIVNWSFISYVEPEYKLAITGITIVLIIFLFVVESALKEPFFKKRYPSRESWSYVTGVLLQRDMGGKLAEAWPNQVVSIVFACATTVIIGTYTAKLTANNIDQDTDSFEGFEDHRLRNPKSRISMYESSSSEIYVNKMPQVKAKRIYSKTADEAILKLYNRNVDFHVSNAENFESLIHKKREYCEELTVFKDERFASEVAFAIQKNSLLGEWVSRLILSMNENEELPQLIKEFNPPSTCMENKLSQFPWEYAGGLVVVILVSVTVCVVIVFGENLYTYCKKRRKRKYVLDQDG